MPWIKKVWAASDPLGGSWLRKWERTSFFTVEFIFKSGYAQLIEWAAKASYEAPITDIYLLISSKEPIRTTENIRIITEQNDKKIIGIRRWGAFTTTLLELSKKDIRILEIGGNDEIVVSVLVDNSHSINFNKIEMLYESNVVTSNDVKRIVYLLPVEKLLPFVKYAQYNNIEVEHIYDY